MKNLYFLFLGGIFTLSLFLFMTFLIKPQTEKAVPTGKTATYVAFKIDDKPPKKLVRPLLKKPELIKAPKTVKSNITRKMPKSPPSFSEHSLVFSNEGMKVAVAAGIGIKPWGRNGGGGNQIQPNVRVNPTYPLKAARENIEGFVTLSFDISEIGRPMNITILESKPRGFFEQSAKKALKKWKYDPESVKNGMNSQQVTLAFQLENEA